MQFVFNTPSVFEKLKLVESEVHFLLDSRLSSARNPAALALASAAPVPATPARDIGLHSDRWPGRAGLQSREGQARLLHDLANIELQAVELGLRTLHEFRAEGASRQDHGAYSHGDWREFREELARITLEEASHLELCLRGLEDLGFSWGDWPVQTSLWDATSADDSLIDRILIVHCYLEGSGLDAGDILLNRLAGVHDRRLNAIVRQIVRDEIGHVDFGRRWFQHFCEADGLDPARELPERLNQLCTRLPARGARVSRDRRLEAGFSPDEITIFDNFQRAQLDRR